MSMAALLVMAGSSGFAAKPDYNVLNRRIASNQLEEETVSCILLDTMVPRQRINYQFGPPISEGLQEAKEDGRCIGILGMNFKNGQILRRGVEARIESMSPYMKTDGYFSSHSISPFDAPNMRGYTALDTTLVGGRRFELVKTACDWPPAEPIFLAKVRWLEEGEASSAAVARAELLQGLAEEWVDLVRTTERERSEGQMTRLLTDLGPMPDAEDADERALWTSALINPLPALGVAPEVRAAVLEATETMTKVELVHDALVESIKQIKKRPKGPFEVEPPPPRYR